MLETCYPRAISTVDVLDLNIISFSSCFAERLCGLETHRQLWLHSTLRYWDESLADVREQYSATLTRLFGVLTLKLFSQ